LDRKSDTSIAETRKKIDSAKARLEAKATALEGRNNKGKIEVNNDIDLVRKDMKELEANIETKTHEVWGYTGDPQ
jgi:hypothetical protein